MLNIYYIYYPVFWSSIVQWWIKYAYNWMKLMIMYNHLHLLNGKIKFKIAYDCPTFNSTINALLPKEREQSSARATFWRLHDYDCSSSSPPSNLLKAKGCSIDFRCCNLVNKGCSSKSALISLRATLSQKVACLRKRL